MIDITMIIEAIIAIILALVSTFLIPWLKEKRESEKYAKVFDIAEQVVGAAWELDITGELVQMGVTKVEYAWTEAKKILASKNITVDDDELKAYIKNAVAQLRINRGDTFEVITAPENADA